ncbi:hypothetical protein JM79_0793 [Gramella sp. Hel_I_59]|uniref:hypothetical protein n=1 Tax=Gramella sp. Hel_I_59 TaxID=1249978 RepID=UPI001154212E|nr:hypothetical protein [Gramella sp. Hel_I_59]TQI69900.1 hypothetical protein JM79_0793 [Gramella sp. Hel_I_59]
MDASSNTNSEEDDRKANKRIFLIVISSIIVLIIVSIAEVLRNNLDLNNPLIDKALEAEVSAPILKNVLTNISGLLLILILNHFKYKRLAIIVGIITIATNFIIDFS